MRCEYCSHDFQPARLYSPTAPNRPRFCSAACRGRGYRKRKDQAIDQELVRAAAAIQRAREALQRGDEEKT